MRYKAGRAVGPGINTEFKRLRQKNHYEIEANLIHSEFQAGLCCTVRLCLKEQTKSKQNSRKKPSRPDRWETQWKRKGYVQGKYLLLQNHTKGQSCVFIEIKPKL